MDTKIDLEHIKSLKEFAHMKMRYLGRNVSGISSEDPNIFMTYILTRDGLVSYIVAIGERGFAFGIKTKLEKTLKTYEPNNLRNIWVDEVLCDVVDYSSGAGTYLNFADQHSFSSVEERDAIVALFEKFIIARGRPNPLSKAKVCPKRLMFTERAKKQLAAYDDLPTHATASSSGLSRRSKKRQGKWMRFLQRGFRRQGD